MVNFLILPLLFHNQLALMEQHMGLAIHTVDSTAIS
jgi:hypothetical protein